MGDDYCAVCAENLEWTAYAQCGHTDTCSKCVARLRVVLSDTRCVICQQSDSAVVVTRYAGEYTNKLPASEFPTLKVRSAWRPGMYLPAAGSCCHESQALYASAGRRGARRTEPVAV